MVGTITGHTMGSMSNLCRGSATQSVVKTQKTNPQWLNKGFIALSHLPGYRFLYPYNTYNTHTLFKNLFDFDFQALSQNLLVSIHHACRSSSKVNHVTGWSLTVSHMTSYVSNRIVFVTYGVNLLSTP